MPAHSLYQRQMFENMRLLPVWLPGDRIALGDIGVVDGGKFHKESSLTELGIQYVTASGSQPRTVLYQASASTKSSAAISGHANGAGRGKVSLEFSAKGAFIFHAVGLRDQVLEERQALYADLLRAKETMLWRDPQWMLVEGLYVADSATVLVSEDDAASIELEGNVAALAATPLQLGDASAGLSVTSQSGRIVQIVSGRKTNLLFSGVRVKAGLFGKTRVVRGSGHTTEEGAGPTGKHTNPEQAFVNVDISELV